MKYYGGGSAKKIMKAGGTNMLGDLNKDGMMSGYETKRQTAIEKSMAKGKAAYGMQTGKPALTSAMNGYEMKHGGSCGKVYKKGFFRNNK
mgnify:FL=1